MRKLRLTVPTTTIYVPHGHVEAMILAVRIVILGVSYTSSGVHLVHLQAQNGALMSPRVTIRLWFHAQDHVTGEPLRLAPHA